jgi:outer membrane protein OmpA-like peptidoglycan-associated protein
MKSCVSIVIISVLLSGCIINQDITFHKNGQISYKMRLHVPYQETVINQTKMIENHGMIYAGQLIDTLKVALYEKQLAGLRLLAGMEVHKDFDLFFNRFITFTISGHFNNMEELNQASAAVPLLIETVDEFKVFETLGLNAYFDQYFVYAQDKDVFAIHSEPLPRKMTRDYYQNKASNIRRFFEWTYPYTTDYTFPSKIKTVNNPSSDWRGNKASINYGQDFFFQPERANIVFNSLGDIYISFLINSSEILPDEAAKIKELAEYLKANSDVSVKIGGSADYNTGSVRFNEKLALDRASQVADLLHDYGYGYTKISAGYHSCDTPALFPTNKQNRCAIIFLLHKPL